MKKMRKGFTLVELLIVVAILAVLSAVMTASITGQTAKAKASAILNNVAACKKAAEYFYAANWDNATTMSSSTTSGVVTAYVANFDSSAGLTEGSIKYTYSDVADKAGTEKWAIKVDFGDDGENQAIAESLVAHAGYSTALKKTGGTYPTSFTVLLYTGAISATE